MFYICYEHSMYISHIRIMDMVQEPPDQKLHEVVALVPHKTLR